MELKSLQDIFKSKIFRIPDYQRGYAWKKEHYSAFWEDLVNLQDDHIHYTGMITLQAISKDKYGPETEEHWLLDEHGYTIYHVVDGQQRFTTFIIFLQALIDFIRELEGNTEKKDSEIFLGTINLETITEEYLVKVQKPNEVVKTYRFGYTEDNPSYAYLRHEILGEPNPGTLDETFYTLNLINAYYYFYAQVEDLYTKEGIEGIRSIYKKLTQKLKFIEYIIGIDTELDVFVVFETMNNRGKKLSNLELLKNRLIYLTTLYSDKETDTGEKNKIRDNINEAWKEIYYQLGRNKNNPLNDDDFLRAHWIIYYKFSRKKGEDYITDLLTKRFSPRNINNKIEVEVALETTEEFVEKTTEEEDTNGFDTSDLKYYSKLKPTELNKYIGSIKEAAKAWFISRFPEMVSELSIEEKNWLLRLNRIGMGYFRPLVTSMLLSIESEEERLKIYAEIEKYIMIIFKLSGYKSNAGDSIFYNAARELYYGSITTQTILQMLRKEINERAIVEGTSNQIKVYFENIIKKQFNDGWGFYGWSAIRYFLYEYEQHLTRSTGHSDLNWNSFTKFEKDKLSIEHILPQTADDKYWKSNFKGQSEKKMGFLKGSLGNLLPLSASINSSLQNQPFPLKKEPVKDKDGNVLRAGYKNGSHSERRVAVIEDWTPEAILDRGLLLLKFMEKRWDISLGTREDKVRLLGLSFLIEN
jgi:uncharacterized protein with ParB-like and HNH nuclease domain